MGETGRVANLLVEGARALRIELPTNECFMNAYNIFDNRRIGIKTPTIIIVVDCEFSGLYSEQGRKFNDDSEINDLKITIEDFVIAIDLEGKLLNKMLAIMLRGNIYLTT